MKSVDRAKYEALKEYCEKHGYRIIKKTIVEQDDCEPEVHLLLREKPEPKTESQC